MLSILTDTYRIHIYIRTQTTHTHTHTHIWMVHKDPRCQMDHPCFKLSGEELAVGAVGRKLGQQGKFAGPSHLLWLHHLAAVQLPWLPGAAVEMSFPFEEAKRCKHANPALIT